MKKVTVRLFFATLLIAACACPAWAAANFDQVKREFRPSDTLILDRSGEVIQRLRSDATVRRGQWVALPDISPALRTALVLSEDKRFYDHSGVDWRAVSSAAWGNLWNTRTRGASTLSMQLAGLMDEDWRAGAGGRSIVQKVGQTVSAQVLEARWRKDQILEAYLNLVPFRGEMVGIDALSRTLFDKAAHGLDEREAAIAAALVRAPNAKVAQVSQRACGVLKVMQAPAKVDCEGLDLFAAAALQRKAFDASEGVAPHLARRLLALRASSPAPKGKESLGAEPATPKGERGGNESALLPLPPGDGKADGSSNLPSRTLTSTLRAPLQRFAVQTLTQQLRELHGRHVEDGAIVVLDNATGEVLAWVGSSGELSGAAEVDGVTALRQPGSTLKPFLYAQAIAERRITAASLLEDSSSQIQTAGGLYIPQNYDRQFKGLVSARTALGASLNVPAVRTLVMVSPDAFHKQLKAVGLPLRESGDYYGYSLALGSSEVSLLSLANAYRTLANGGRYSAPSLAKNPKPVFRPALDARAAFITTDIMSDPMARARTFGTDSILATRFWTAVKTGTSKDMRDNWAMGFSQRYTVGVWVGNASGAPMWDVSGTSGAAPIWAALMNYLHKTERSRAPTPPAGLVQSQTRFSNQGGTPLEAARSEWFIKGTEQSLFAINSGAASVHPERSAARNSTQKGIQKTVPEPDAVPRITAPASGTIIALDPDIPPKHQRISFSAEGRGTRWLIDGKEFARGPRAQWLPWPGRHVVQLLDANGKVADEIKFEVRGAGVREASARGGAPAVR
ncbi:transglycosylase domain-containing protein [Polaromonas sp.]|uniref:transglycosylase domain-containing protein n=1 Tax=Polaromonas sp. TaxID=1869339 RepID=UPI003266C718